MKNIFKILALIIITSCSNSEKEDWIIPDKQNTLPIKVIYLNHTNVSEIQENALEVVKSVKNDFIYTNVDFELQDFELINDLEGYNGINDSTDSFNYLARKYLDKRYLTIIIRGPQYSAGTARYITPVITVMEGRELTNTVSHEIGHFLGIAGHSDNKNNIMSRATNKIAYFNQIQIEIMQTEAVKALQRLEL